jgi:protein phosphatase 1 regulatory subunit 11
MSTVTTVIVSAPTVTQGSGPSLSGNNHVTWAEGTVDNEQAGKKKSKKCCIFKKRKNFGESSSSDEDVCHH